MSHKLDSEPKPRLLELVRSRIRVKHYSIRTETAYVDWIKRFILFHRKRYPLEMGAPEAEAFLTSLAVDRNVAASTQNQALAAMLLRSGQPAGHSGLMRSGSGCGDRQAA